MRSKWVRAGDAHNEHPRPGCVSDNADYEFAHRSEFAPGGLSNCCSVPFRQTWLPAKPMLEYPPCVRIGPQPQSSQMLLLNWTLDTLSVRITYPPDFIQLYSHVMLV